MSSNNEAFTTYCCSTYGMYSHIYTLAEIRDIVISDPFDRSEAPRQIKLVDLTDWLEAVVS
ncbi:hypothetical protein [Ktedonobacter racemifer]|nr:hypothetical protein [Ktedonobacter racemifer]